MSSHPMSRPLTRRALLGTLGMLTGAAILSACGGSDESPATATSGSGSSGSGSGSGSSASSQPTATTAAGGSGDATGGSGTPTTAGEVTAVGPTPTKPHEVDQWLYSTLLLDKTTLKRVPQDKTDNVIDFFDWNVEQFKDVNPDTIVKIERLPHDQNWFAKLSAQLAAGTQPDIVQGPVSEAATYIPFGAVSPIDEYMSAEDKADIVEAVAKESSFDGKNYIWPWRLSFGGGIQINATLWKEHGAGDLLPTGETRRWLMDDCLEAFKRTTVDDNGDGKPELYGTVLMTDIHYHSTQFMFGFGARLFNEDESEFILNSPEGVEGLEWLVALEHEHKVAIPGSATRKAAEAGQLFTEKKAASYPSQGSGLEPPQIDYEWYWVPPPNVEGKEPAVMTNVHGHYVLNQKDADRTIAAHQYTRFLVRPEALAISLHEFGMPPARQSLWGEVTDENQKVGLRFTEIMISFGRRASASEITFTVLPRMLEAAYSKQKTPQQALDDAAEESNKLIQEAMSAK